MSQATQEFSQTQETFVCSGADRVEVQSWGRLISLNDRVRNYELIKDEYIVGRNGDCDVVIEMSAISGKHCRIYRDEQGVFIVDHSTNGTFINGQKLLKGDRNPLGREDIISFAAKKQHAFVFQDTIPTTDCAALDSQYILLRQLGAGACGVVHLAVHKVTGVKYAVKIVQKNSLTGRAKNDIMSEALILKSIDHPFIISMHEVFESPIKVYFVLEYANGGEVFNKIQESGPFPDHEAKYLFAQMLLGVQYLHDKGIAHRDLKPENVLLSVINRRSIIKITDFGLAKLVEVTMRTMCGTLTYLAPEVLKNGGHRDRYTSAVDCWSLGVILFVFLSGTTPFNETPTSLPITEQIIRGMYHFDPSLWRSVSPLAVDLIRRLLVLDPRKRATVDDALAHEWIRDEAQRIRGELLAPPADTSASLMPPPTALPSQRQSNPQQHQPTRAAVPDDVTPKNDSTDDGGESSFATTCAANAAAGADVDDGPPAKRARLVVKVAP
eukprot:Opistho-2@82104